MVLVAMIVTFAAPTSASPSSAPPVATPLVTGLASGSGSAVGPGGALYVTEGATGRVLRVNPKTGAVTTFASGLPKSIIGIGGAMDVAFLGSTAYVLVTLVGPDVGGSDTVGIYRVDGPTSFTVIADIGTFSIQHPPVPHSHSQRRPIRDKYLSRRLPGDRRPPQPRASASRSTARSAN